MALAAAGCGKAAEKTLEEAIERQIEEEGESGDVNVDLDDDGGISIETDEGSFQIGGNEIPDGFLLPIPDYEEISAVSSQTGEFAGAMVTVTFDPDEFEDVAEMYEDFFNDQGWEISRTDANTGNDRMVIIYGEGDELSASAIVGYTDGADVATVTAQYNSTE
jgi:hypothetical protein